MPKCFRKEVGYIDHDSTALPEESQENPGTMFVSVKLGHIVHAIISRPWLPCSAHLLLQREPGQLRQIQEDKSSVQMCHAKTLSWFQLA